MSELTEYAELAEVRERTNNRLSYYLTGLQAELANVRACLESAQAENARFKDALAESAISEAIKEQMDALYHLGLGSTDESEGKLKEVYDALAFYADPDNWQAETILIGPKFDTGSDPEWTRPFYEPVTKFSKAMYEDKGARARAVLPDDWPRRETG
jgi:hypothetical protein